jgi:hypothetical protein
MHAAFLVYTRAKLHEWTLNLQRLQVKGSL